MTTATSSTETALIGPNSVTRTLEAITEAGYPPEAERIASEAGLPGSIPNRMVPEAWFVALTRAVREAFDQGVSEAILADSGSRTARYVAAHRIPAPIRFVLRVLPGRVALPLLLRAIERHAWTFAGSGRFAVEGRPPRYLVLEDAPTCRYEACGGIDRRPVPGGAYYAAAFEGLLRLADDRVRVREVECALEGAAACRFILELEGAPVARPLHLTD